MSKQLCLHWSEFKENANTLIENLRDDSDFTDVTLACEDGKHIDAHRVILAASSPIFKSLLAKQKHPNPLIFMRGVDSANLAALVDFLYRGEANVTQDNIDSFLLLADGLKLKGLVGSRNDIKKEPSPSSSPGFNSELNRVQQANKSLRFQPEQMSKSESTIVTKYNSDDYLQQLDEKVKSLIEKSAKRMSVGKSQTRVCVCKICGKEGQWVAIRDHIETKHLEGVSLVCDQCGKTSKSRHGLRLHKNLIHKEQQ